MLPCLVGDQTPSICTASVEENYAQYHVSVLFLFSFFVRFLLLGSTVATILYNIPKFYELERKVTVRKNKRAIVVGFVARKKCDLGSVVPLYAKFAFAV